MKIVTEYILDQLTYSCIFQFPLVLIQFLAFLIFIVLHSIFKICVSWIWDLSDNPNQNTQRHFQSFHFHQHSLNYLLIFTHFHLKPFFTYFAQSSKFYENFLDSLRSNPNHLHLLLILLIYALLSSFSPFLTHQLYILHLHYSILYLLHLRHLHLHHHSQQSHLFHNLLNLLLHLLHHLLPHRYYYYSNYFGPSHCLHQQLSF